VVVNAADDAGAGLNHLPEDVFLPNDIDIVFEVGGGRDGIREGGEVGDAADGFELVFILQFLLKGHDLDGGFVVVHLDEGIEDDLVAEVVEDFDALLELLDADAHRFVGGKENAAEDALFGLDGVGRKAVDALRAGKAGGEAGAAGALGGVVERAAGFGSINHGN